MAAGCVGEEAILMVLLKWLLDVELWKKILSIIPIEKQRKKRRQTKVACRRERRGTCGGSRGKQSLRSTNWCNQHCCTSHPLPLKRTSERMTSTTTISHFFPNIYLYIYIINSHQQRQHIRCRVQRQSARSKQNAH